MIAHLSGTVKSKQNRNLVLDVGGVGYLVNVTHGLLEKTQENEALDLYVHTHVREDDISLYGLATAEQWHFFELLLTVSGIGPRSALEILNAPLTKVKQAIAEKDVAYLTTIQGIGKKTAQRIIVDLQSKTKETLVMEELEKIPTSDDIISALMSLGYHRQQVLHGLKKVPPGITDEKTIIKYFLQNI